MDRVVFTDSANDKVFKEQGFLTAGLFDEATMQHLKKLAEDCGFKTAGTDKKRLTGIHVSLYDTRKDVRELFFDGVWNLIKARLQNFVQDYEPVMINFWSKVPGGGSLELHQNWTHVDEEKFISMSLWIPLQPTSRKNGTIELVPGSQRKISDIRGPGIDHVFRNIQQQIISNDLVPINLQTGEVVFLDDSILHYTGNNTDINSRDSIQVLLKPVEAPALFFTGNNRELGNEVQCYEVERNFFSNLNPGKLGREPLQYARPVKSFTRDFKQLSLQAYKSLLAG
jgi:Phytanoyl-CoA dioxygenase (PhyH)